MFKSAFKDNTKTKSDFVHELRLMRSLVISVAGQDEEGRYNPQFIKKIMAATSDSTEYAFKTSTEFLRQLAAV